MPKSTAAQSTNLSDLVTGRFEAWLVRQGRASATIDTYRWALRDLLRFLCRHDVVDAGDLTLDRRLLLEEWQDGHLQRALRPRTRALLMVAARQYLRWLAREGLVDNRLQWMLDRPRVPQGLPRPIPQEDVRRLVSYLLPRLPMMRLLDLRDRAMFFFFLASSARVSEALQIRRDQLEQPVIQKGGSEKVLRVPAVVQVMVDDYLAARDDDCCWLWATHENHLAPRRLDVAGVRESWHRLCANVGVPRFTCHQIRHTSASILFDLGLDSLEVADHLGHSGLAHVKGYVALLGRGNRAVNAMQAFISGAGDDGHRPAA